MSRYKLIKKFPLSPEVGYIVDFTKSDFVYHVTDIITSLSETDCSNFPEFWEKLMTYKYKKGDIVEGLPKIGSFYIEKNRVSTSVIIPLYMTENSNQKIIIKYFHCYSLLDLNSDIWTNKLAGECYSDDLEHFNYRFTLSQDNMLNHLKNKLCKLNEKIL